MFSPRVRVARASSHPHQPGPSGQADPPAFGPGSGAAAILSVLPRPVQPAAGDSFNDRILLLLAAVARSDGLLTYRAYQLVQDAARAIFGERALHAEVQAKLHHALLHPPADASELARSMAHEAEARQVSAAFIDTLLASLTSISAHSERMDETARSLVREIDLAFRASRLEQDKGLGFSIDVGQSLTRLRRLAERALPERLSPAHLLPERLLPASLFSGFKDRAREGGALLPETSAFNAGMEAAAASLERIAWTLDDPDLLEELHAFKKTLRAQPFKIVVVGERKRGKSSLVNAIIGRKLSPVRESAPETATVLEFRHAPAPDYSVRFLDSAQFARLEEYLAGEEGNLLLARKIRTIRDGVAKGTFTPGKWLSGLSCLDELEDYVSLNGRFSGFVARVSVGLPLESLHAGVTLVDTPGLNDTDRFHDYLAYEESLEADCVLFVMDARDPGSRSELELLRRLARSGRAVRIIGVLTNIDKLNDAASLDRSREQARSFLLEACRSSEHVRLAGLTAINAREAVNERCAGEEGGADSGEMGQLLRLLRDVMELDSGKLDYRRKTADTWARLVRVTQDRIADHMKAYRASLPGTDFLDMLDAHARQLNEAALLSLAQARQVVEATGKELDAWDRETDNALARFRENLALRLMDAVNRKVTELEHDFARDDAWRDFDASEARLIARQAVDAFLDDQREALRNWEDKLRLFSADMDAFSRDCLARLSASVTGLPEEEADGNPARSGTSGLSNTAAHFLVQSHRHMKHVALFTAGLATGRASAFASVTLLVTAGNILALAAANPAAAAIFAAMAGTAGLIYHLGREDKRKAALLDKKRRDIEAYASRVADLLAAELETARTGLGKAYEFEVRRGFAPALESLFQQAAHLRLFLDVMHHIRADADLYEAHVRRELAELHRPSLVHAGDAASAPALDTTMPIAPAGGKNACPTRDRGN